MLSQLFTSVLFEVMYISDSRCNGKQSFPKPFSLLRKVGWRPVLKIYAEVHIRKLKQNIAGAIRIIIRSYGYISRISLRIEIDSPEAAEILDHTVMVPEIIESFELILECFPVSRDE